MWLSTRKMFRRGDPGWADYIGWIRLPELTEVRTIDILLNECVEGCDTQFCEPTDADLARVLALLPVPKLGAEYYLLAANLDEESAPERLTGFTALGHDISDSTTATGESSLLNCGPWEGALKPLTTRLNEVGLLSLEDARIAQTLLPREWSDNPHADVNVWALYGKELGAPGF